MRETTRREKRSLDLQRTFPGTVPEDSSRRRPSSLFHCFPFLVLDPSCSEGMKDEELRREQGQEREREEGCGKRQSDGRGDGPSCGHSL